MRSLLLTLMQWLLQSFSSKVFNCRLSVDLLPFLELNEGKAESPFGFSRWFFFSFTVGRYEELLQISKTLKFKSLQNYIENDCFHRLRTASGFIDENVLHALRVCEKHGIKTFLKHQLEWSKRLKALNLLRDPNFKALQRETRYEILKVSIKEKLRHVNT